MLHTMPIYIHFADSVPERPADFASTAQFLRRHARALRAFAGRVAALEADGWTVHALPFGGLSVGFAEHTEVRTKAEARRRLAALGVDLPGLEIYTRGGRTDVAAARPKGRRRTAATG